MPEALIGLIGVIAGALLGGVVNADLERRKRRAAAVAAGWLIVSELEVSVRRITSALEESQLWKGDLPNEAWKANASDLSFDLRRLEPGQLTPQPGRSSQTSQPQQAEEPSEASHPGQAEEPSQASQVEQAEPSQALQPEPNILQRLAAAYAIIDRSNVLAEGFRDVAEPKNAAPEIAPTDANTGAAAQKLLRDLTLSRDAIQEAKRFLEQGLRTPRGAGLRSARRGVSLVLGAALLVTLISATFVKRSDVTRTTVASSLQAQLARLSTLPTTVDCDPKGDDWHCTASNQERGNACASATAASSRHAPVAKVRFVQVAERSCVKRSTYDATLNGNKLEYVRDASARNEVNAAAAVIVSGIHKKSYWKTAWDWVRG
jgi:hypothetical protein